MKKCIICEESVQPQYDNHYHDECFNNYVNAVPFREFHIMFEGTKQVVILKTPEEFKQVVFMLNNHRKERSQSTNIIN